VLGTSFWIDAGKGAKKISVKVKTGKVGVVHGHQPAIFLFPSETAVFNTISGVLAKVKQPVSRTAHLSTSEDAPAALVFNETPLKQVINALAENFKLSISMQDSIDTDLPVSLNTKGKTVPEILQQIKSQTHIDYAIKDKKIIIRKQQ
jgi:ferric-dicitrate binding protein FerR (iron transport regulator)